MLLKIEQCVLDECIMCLINIISYTVQKNKREIFKKTFYTNEDLFKIHILCILHTKTCKQKVGFRKKKL